MSYNYFCAITVFISLHRTGGFFSTSNFSLINVYVANHDFTAIFFSIALSEKKRLKTDNARGIQRDDFRLGH